MFDHLGIKVADVPASRRFYVDALQTLGVAVVAESNAFVMMGGSSTGKFVLGKGERPSAPVHIAFTAATRDDVRRFHAAAIAAGGRDNGAPGIRSRYSPTYYGAFVFDPDGNNVEAVCRAAGE